jgi:hypothetical protein
VNETCKGIWAPFIEGTTPRNICETEHPPPDPDKPKYKNMWVKKAEVEQEAQRAKEPPQMPEEGETEETEAEANRTD